MFLWRCAIPPDVLSGVPQYLGRSSGSKGYPMNVPLRVFPTSIAQNHQILMRKMSSKTNKYPKTRAFGWCFCWHHVYPSGFTETKSMKSKLFYGLPQSWIAKKSSFLRVIYSSIYSSMAEEFTPQQNMILHQPQGSGHWEPSRTMETPEITTGSW